MACIGETYVAADEETEAELARKKKKKLINSKLCLTSMLSYADQLKMKLRQFENYTEAAREVREKNARRRAERRAEVTPEERIHAREINATHQRASRTGCELRFVGTATGEVEVDCDL